MNQFLTELYGTRETIGAVPDTSDDVEKLAEAELLDQILTNEGYDVDKLDGDTILKVAYSLFGDESEIVKEALDEGSTSDEEEEEEEEEEGEDEEEKKAELQEKLAEADFLGRAMAHAYVNELAGMDKEAGPVLESLKGVGRAIGGAAKGTKGSISGAVKKPLESLKGMKKEYETARFGVKKPGKAGRKMTVTRKAMGTPSQSRTMAALETLQKSPTARKALAGAAGVGGAGLLAGGVAAGRASKGSKKKAASALDMLAEQRALDLLKEAGFDIDGNEHEVDIEETKLASAVEDRAWEMLKENGFVQE